MSYEVTADETWKDIPGFEGIYQASNLGRVKSLDRYTNTKCGNRCFWKGKILTQHKSTTGYYLLILSNTDGVPKTCKVHRLIAAAFLPNLNNHPVINHIDGNRVNNKVENLEWCTHSYNMYHSYRSNGRKGAMPLLGRTGASSHVSKPVYQIDPATGKIINRHDSVRIAEHTTNSYGITRSIKLNIKAGGFKWQFAS